MPDGDDWFTDFDRLFADRQRNSLMACYFENCKVNIGMVAEGVDLDDRDGRTRSCCNLNLTVCKVRCFVAVIDRFANPRSADNVLVGDDILRVDKKPVPLALSVWMRTTAPAHCSKICFGLRGWAAPSHALTNKQYNAAIAHPVVARLASMRYTIACHNRKWHRRCYIRYRAKISALGDLEKVLVCHRWQRVYIRARRKLPHGSRVDHRNCQSKQGRRFREGVDASIS